MNLIFFVILTFFYMQTACTMNQGNHSCRDRNTLRSPSSSRQVYTNEKEVIIYSDCSTPGCCRRQRTYCEVFCKEQAKLIIVKIKEKMLKAGNRPRKRLLQFLSDFKETHQEEHQLLLKIRVALRKVSENYKRAIQYIVHDLREIGWCNNPYCLVYMFDYPTFGIRQSPNKPLYTIETNKSGPQQMVVYLSEGFLMSPTWYKNPFACWRSNDFIEQLFIELRRKKQAWKTNSILILYRMPTEFVIKNQRLYYHNTIEPNNIIEYIKRKCSSRRLFGRGNVKCEDLSQPSYKDFS